MNTRITRSIEWINCLLQKRSPQPANRLRPRRSRGTPHTLRYCGSVTCKSSSVVFRLSLSLSLSLSFSFSISLSLSLPPSPAAEELEKKKRTMVRNALPPPRGCRRICPKLQRFLLPRSDNNHNHRSPVDRSTNR